MEPNKLEKQFKEQILKFSLQNGLSKLDAMLWLLTQYRKQNQN
jgi:hypothetical protein